MTDEHAAAPEPVPAANKPSDAPGSQETGGTVSLTDFFDQLDRAAFQQALANRDAIRNTVVRTKFQRR